MGKIGIIKDHQNGHMFIIKNNSRNSQVEFLNDIGMSNLSYYNYLNYIPFTLSTNIYWLFIVSTVFATVESK